jgi:GDP-4-dehydro-6-deoxy-D-mannose reductase
MRVLITGGGGFLAGHLSAYLRTIDRTHVFCLGRSECDLSEGKEPVRSALHSFEPELVFHLAGRINGSEAELDRDNRRATINLLDAVQLEVPAARIVLGSTTAVYRDGGTAASPLDESALVGAGGFYAASKYAAEQHARSYAKRGDWVVIARMSNPIGSNMGTALLCGTMARQIVAIERGMPPVVTLRDLSAKRDFISVHDCARALCFLGEFGEPGATYNVASGSSTPITEIVDVYLRLSRVRPIHVRVLSSGDERSPISEQWLSNARLLALGWKPQESIADAIQRQLEAERARP